MYWGPGDRYRFLVTGAESGGTYFAMEALVPPGGGPPPRIHRNEDETFYVVEGEMSIRLGESTVVAGAGDLVDGYSGLVTCDTNDGGAGPRMILTFTPAGIEEFFEETLEQALDSGLEPPDNHEAVAARYVAAAPRYGLGFVTD